MEQWIDQSDESNAYLIIQNIEYQLPGLWTIVSEDEWSVYLS